MDTMNNLSYEDYMKHGLDSLSKNFSVKVYKLASQEEWTGFERGKDLRIQIQWKGKCVWEWVLEKTFWIQRNTNKEDRVYMRKHADVKLNAFKNAIIKKKPIKKKMAQQRVGHTQDCFEKMKEK